MPRQNGESNIFDFRDQLDLLEKYKLVLTGSFAFYIQLGMEPAEALKSAGDIDVVVERPKPIDGEKSIFRELGVADQVARSHFDIVYEDKMPLGWKNRISSVWIKGHEVRVVDKQDIFVSFLAFLESALGKSSNYPIYNVEWLRKFHRLIYRVIHFLNYLSLTAPAKEAMILRLQKAIQPLREDKSYDDRGISTATIAALEKIAEQDYALTEQLLRNNLIP